MTGATLTRPVDAIRPYMGLMGVLAGIALIVALAVSGAFSGIFSHSSPSPGPPPGIVVVGSSWVTGEPSLASSSQFAAIESRAVALAQTRWNAREALIAEIIAAKKAAALKRREDLLKKYAELRAKELAAYRAEVLKIQRERAAQEAKLAAERKKYEQELAAYMRARRVTPGQECKDPLVRRYYSCGNGLLPAHP
jgi:hypothetical protein